MSDELSGEQSGIAVEARGLTKRYGDLVAVNAIDFEVRRGTCLGVLGPNGAGKTTTIEMLEGLKVPDGGSVTVLGRTWADDPVGIQERIGVQLQETDFQDKLTAYEILRLFRSFYREGADLEAVLEVVGLQEKRDARVKNLSGGQKQRLSIGCALLNQPDLLFLDEPTTGLDPQARRRVWEIVERFKADGGTVLLTTHYMEEAEQLADDLIVVDAGKIIARGSPAELIANLDVENLVQFALEEGCDLEASVLEGIEGVNAVRTDGDGFTLSAVGTQSVIVSLFQLAEDRNVRISDLRTHRPTLEDVFVTLTGKTLRDE